MTTRNSRRHRGFTLVELLVVISIIGMLAGLLLPAVNAARESGRRATCVANQNQIALALINYDSTKNELPPLRGNLYDPNPSNPDAARNSASWIGYILPQLENNQLYNNLKSNKFWGGYYNGTTGSFDKNDGIDENGNFVGIQLLQCKSAVNAGAKPAKTNYVANGGYQNAAGTSWTGSLTATNCEPGKLADAVFFDNIVVGSSQKGSINYIGNNGGTSTTILLSENLQGGLWAKYQADGTGAANGNYYAYSGGETSLAFTYPFNISVTATGSASTGYTFPTEARLWSYGSDADKYSYKAWDNNTNTANPAFINWFKESDASVDPQDIDYGYNWRTARPSSYHPGIVVAAFADRSVRTLNDTMDKLVYIYICSPNSGKVVDLNNL